MYRRFGKYLRVERIRGIGQRVSDDDDDDNDDNDDDDDDGFRRPPAVEFREPILT